jgi:uncharacterized protein YwqG
MGSFVVMHTDAKAEVVPASWPDDLPKRARYRECPFFSEETVTLPPWESLLIDALNLTAEQLDAYQNLLEKTYQDDRWSTRAILGGHPEQIQGDIMLECAIVAAGLHCGDGSAYQDPRLPIFRGQARQWRLLFQVPSSDAAGMMWGDLGCLYYCIRDEDLRARRFERSWMILQCS